MKRVQMLVHGISIVACFGFSGMAPFHDFHYSRTDARWQPGTQTVQTTIRVFTDDLEMALREHHELSEEFAIWLGDNNEWAEADSAAFQWLTANLAMELDGIPVQWTWVGKEIELDVSYLYVESQRLPGVVHAWNVWNSMLFRQFGDQVNELQLRIDCEDGEPLERREMLTADMPAFRWQVEKDASNTGDE